MGIFSNCHVYQRDVPSMRHHYAWFSGWKEDVTTYPGLVKFFGFLMPELLGKNRRVFCISDKKKQTFLKFLFLVEPSLNQHNLDQRLAKIQNGAVVSEGG